MPVGFTKENQDLVIESHDGRMEEDPRLSLFPEIQSLHYFVSRDQIGYRLKTFKNSRILLHVRDRNLGPVTLETLASKVGNKTLP